jgi:tRNA (guanine37-N1)-methyltransferase
MIYLKKLIHVSSRVIKTQIATMKIQIDEVKGIKELNRDLFKVNLTIPAIKVSKEDYPKVQALFEDALLESPNLRRCRDIDAFSKYVILDPELMKEKNKLENDEFKSALLKEHKIDLSKDLIDLSVELSYDDLKFEEIMKLVLPDDLLSKNLAVKGYSQVGHIAHFNLKEDQLEYKYLIGQVLLDKIKIVKTVVNKVNSIDNTYRNFSLEILAGEHNTNVQCKENNCMFKFDFAQVYWNSRLSTEHERVISVLQSNDIIYDIFAGVGPFSVPAATKKKCIVLSNDLNPKSYEYLKENYKANMGKALRNEPKIKILNEEFERFQAFNVDGRDFIQTHVRDHLLHYLQLNKKNNFANKSKVYAIMNLPAMATQFLDAFRELFDSTESENLMDYREDFELNIFCYCFAKIDEGGIEEVKNGVKKIFDENIEINSRWVRKVAPNKDMYCLLFKLPLKYLLKKKDDYESDGVECKRKRLK